MGIVLQSLPSGIFQGSGEGGVVIGGMFQGVVPRSSSLDGCISVLATQGILQCLVKGCFAIGSALTFFKLL